MSAPLQQANTNTQPAKGLPSMLQKKGLLGAAGRGKMNNSIVSPTDNVLSPCSAKLSGAKQRHFQKYVVLPAHIPTLQSTIQIFNHSIHPTIST
ncbi:hypothetical protein BCR39DRAFT_293013 [Naematelia encephala]|uniref:Uncharacterized protein n=1 Tax=Naematelia encephala TaxID=71784 RepID=A0A1Y2ARS7_9TREE|nr:hypothetical protein BCR39DRAFT_293013 [Naematelia encephala]